MKNKYLVKSGTVASIFVIPIFLVLMNTISVRGTNVADEVTITIPFSCSLTDTLTSAHTATVENGVYQENIGETIFKVFCNDNEGFSVYAVGYTNDEFGNTSMKPSTVDVSNAIATGLATSGTTSNWAMKLTAISGDYAPTIENSFGSYHAIPSNYQKVASFDSNTDTTAGSSFKSTYATYASPTQVADSYTGKVKYVVVHPSSELAPIENIAQLTYMQDFKNLSTDERELVLNSMQDNTTYNLIDNRDNKTYQIARLKDGNIWMAENLDLGRTDLTTDLTSENTNLSETITAATFNGWRVESGTQSNTKGEFIPLTTSNTSNGLDTDPVSGTSYGTLYNYYATSAGTISGNSNNNDASYDICPAGWRLPTGNDTGEFKILYNNGDNYSYNTIRASIADGGAGFNLAGATYKAPPSNQGEKSIFWSSTNATTADMYDLFLKDSTSNVNILDHSPRSNGYNIRCIAKKSFRSLTVSYSTGVSSVKINGITVQNGGVVNLEEGMPYSVTITTTEGYDLSDWTATSGSIGSSNSATTTYTISSENAILIPVAKLAMQNLDSSNCTSAASQVMDNRDGHMYTIQRLADGRCWMMENLDLGRTTLTKDLTSANTNLLTTITASTFNSWKKTRGSRTYDSGEFIPLTTSNTSNNLDADPTSGTSYGTLYNYYVASAGTISGSSNSNDANYDICPASWRLPTGGSYEEFNALYVQYNSPASMHASIADNGVALALAGYFNGYPDNQGSYGFYWSSTHTNTTNMQRLFVGATSVYPSNTEYRYSGQSIRCILDETKISDLTYMQDFNSITPSAKKSVAKSMSYNTTYNLIDNRDRRTYKIAKLKDDNIWLAENLDLGRTALTKDLTSSNTNISTSVTASTFNDWAKTTGTSSYASAEFILLTSANTENHLEIDPVSGTSYGVLYNYCAATVGTICTSNSYSVASYDICPAGWRLPVGGENGEYVVLYNTTDYNSFENMRASIESGGAGFSLAGYFSTSPTGQGRYSGYWTATRDKSFSSRTYRMSLNSSTVYPANAYERDAGYSIRCVVK